MSKTTNYITSIVLAVAFLVAAQVQAGLTHTFTFRSLPNTTYNTTDAWKDVASALSLTATDNGNGGIDFVLSSTWTGNNGGPGILMGYGYNYDADKPAGYNDVGYNLSFLEDNYVSLNNHDKIFTNKLITSKDNYPYLGGRLATDGFYQEEGSNVWLNSFTLNYADDNDWLDFRGLFVEDNPLTPENEAENGFYLSVTLGDLNGDRNDRTSFASFDTAIPAVASQEGNDNAVPEPATLALMGLGLTGLGMVSRRKRK